MTERPTGTVNESKLVRLLLLGAASAAVAWGPGSARAEDPSGSSDIESAAVTEGAELSPERLAAMDLEELLGIQLKVSADALVQHTSLEAVSTVDLVTQQSWFRQGARRTMDAIAHLPGVAIYPRSSAPMCRRSADTLRPRQAPASRSCSTACRLSTSPRGTRSFF